MSFYFLAIRALGYGTLFAFLGTGTLFYGIWKLSGAKTVSLLTFAMYMNEIINV